MRGAGWEADMEQPTNQEARELGVRLDKLHPAVLKDAKCSSCGFGAMDRGDGMEIHFPFPGDFELARKMVEQAGMA